MIKTISDLMIELSRCGQNMGNNYLINILVNVPSVRPGDEGPARITSIEYDENNNQFLIEVDSN